MLEENACRLVYGKDELQDIEQHVELLAKPMTATECSGRAELLREVELVFSGWGAPRLNREFLRSAPKLQAFFFGAGSLCDIITDAVWTRNPPLTITTAISINAIPVAEYTLAAILFSLKHGWRLARQTRQRRVHDYSPDRQAPGCYKTTVGLISLGTISRKLLPLLRNFDLDVLVYDPFVSDDEVKALGATKTSLPDLFRRSSVVSLHTPHLEETEGMITGELLASMRDGATFINTARPAIVCQDEMIRVARQRPDLQFVLDVVQSHLDPDSPLLTLDNVLLTPHIAGSLGDECRRIGRFMVEELQRYVAGQPLHGLLTLDALWHSSHRPAHVPPSFDSLRHPQTPKPTITVLSRRKRSVHARQGTS